MKKNVKKKKKKYSPEDLTIVICAYKECESLEKSIKKIVNQTQKANVLISTSTPNEHIKNLAEKYGIEVRVNPEGGHVKDYNFAMKQVETPLGMLAHQDDYLHEKFVEENIKMLNKAKNPILAFSNYVEMHDGIVDRNTSTLVKIKRLLILPARIRGFRYTVAAKRLLLCLGNPIVHPSVVCVMKEMPELCFDEIYKASMDWDLWERLSHKKGEFVYVNKVLLCHRMSEDNATAKLLENSNARYDEDYEIMNRFWPGFVTKFIMHFYSKSAKYY